jgi:hypothetical protein
MMFCTYCWKISSGTLQNDSNICLYQRRTDEKLKIECRTAEEEYEHIKKCIKDAAEEALGIYHRKMKPYW